MLELLVVALGLSFAYFLDPAVLILEGITDG